MRAIRALLLDQDAAVVAKIFGVTERTLSRWVNAFNRSGIDGLLDNPRSGRPPKLAKEKHASLKSLIENPEMVGRCHWTAASFHGYLRQDLNEEVGYRTVVRWLHDNNYRLRVPRPWPNRQDPEARTRHLEFLQAVLSRDDVDLWYGDESGFEGDPRPRRRWVQRGSRPTRVKNGDHIRENVMGVIRPRNGEFFAMGFTSCDTECFQAFLDELNKSAHFERETNYLLIDNASWHKPRSLRWGKFTPIYLPAYSPDLNPIERLWLLLKDQWFSDFVAKDRENLIQRLDQALTWAMDSPQKVSQMCTIKTRL